MHLTYSASSADTQRLITIHYHFILLFFTHTSITDQSPIQMNPKIQNYYNRFLQTLAAKERNSLSSISVDHFCADKDSTNLCADLVKHGIKVATCSMKYWYETGREVISEVGMIQVITDWDGNPTSIIEITSVEEKRFCDVDEEFARAEGEGDLSLNWWRKSHWQFFSNECSDLGITPDENMMLILERFKVIYKE